jgi:hypothetical protein
MSARFFAVKAFKTSFEKARQKRPQTIDSDDESSVDSKEKQVQQAGILELYEPLRFRKGLQSCYIFPILVFHTGY